MVEPTKVNPRCFNSLLIASDSLVLAGTSRMLLRLSIDKLPDKSIEASKVGLDLKKRARIPNRGLDFQLVSHNRRIRKELLDFTVIIASDSVRVKAIKRLEVASALSEDQRPAQPCLHPLQDQ